MDRRTPGHYPRAMKSALHLLLVVVLAVVSAGAGVGMTGSSDGASTETAAASDQVGVHMADCDDCTAEQMQVGTQPCGSSCVTPTLAASGLRDFQPVIRPAAGFSLGGSALAGQIRRPELSPPRFS